MNSPASQFAVACPSCGVGLKVGDSDLGTQRDCPKCGAGFMLPTLTEARRLAEAKRQARAQFGFSCRLCGSRLYAMPQHIGRKMKCPDCHAINRISQPPPKAQAKFMPPVEGYDLALADESPVDARPAEELFHFQCRVCQTMLSVPRSWVGRQLPCPDCGTRLVVPFPPPAVTKVHVVAKDPGLTLGVAVPIPQQQFVNVEKLMTAAHEKLVTEAKKKPKPIRRPFLTGVYTYPFYPTSLVYLVLTGVLGGLILTLLRITVELQGLETVIGIPLIIGTVMFSIPLVGLNANYFLKTINWTSLGYSSVGESPPFEFFEFLRGVAFIINALGVSAIPGALIGLALPNRLIALGVLVLGTVVLYPFVILSLLDNDSVFGPYSSFIWSSLGTVRRAWIKFYLSALVPFGMVAGSQVLAIYFPNDIWSYVTIVVTSMALLIYFRLIGRLAYVIDRSIPKGKKPDSSHRFSTGGR